MMMKLVFVVGGVEEMEHIQKLLTRDQELFGWQWGWVLWQLTLIIAELSIPFIMDVWLQLDENSSILLIVASHNKRCTVWTKSIISDQWVIFSLCDHVFLIGRYPSKSAYQILQLFNIGIDCLPIRVWEGFDEFEWIHIHKVFVALVLLRPCLNQDNNPWVGAQVRMALYLI